MFLLRMVAGMLMLAIFMTACKTSRIAPEGYTFLERGPYYTAYRNARGILVENRSCPGEPVTLALSFKGAQNDELVAFMVRMLVDISSQCPETRVAVDENGDLLTACRNVYFASADPSVYHFLNVCPDTELAYRPTEEFCGPVKFLGEDEPTERCLIVFAD